MSEQVALEKMRNLLCTAGLMVLLAAIPSFLAYLLFGTTGLWMAVAGAIGVFILTPSISPGIILRMARARPIEYWQAPDLFEIVAKLAGKARLRQNPKLFLMPSMQTNAFTVGSRTSPCVAISTGLVRHLNRDEMTGVLAHEIAHIRNNDLWLLSLSESFRRMTSSLSIFGIFLLMFSLPVILFSGNGLPLLPVLLLLTAPMLSALVLLAISRTREFGADLEAASLVGSPVPLINALAKIEYQQMSFFERLLNVRLSNAIPGVLRTHPATSERLRRLRELTGRHSNGFAAIV